MQFTIQQDKCSMKVCTDACIFGSWVAGKVAGYPLPVARCLDIGTGTGLLSLILAQKIDADIDAIEMEENSFEQAKENFENSPWSQRLHIFHKDAKEFTVSKKYHLIISNPPFFENDLLSGEKNKNIAKHHEGLNLKELISIIKQHLGDNGSFAVLLPYHRIQYFEKLADENGFYLEEKVLVKQTPRHNYFRGILFFGVQKEIPSIKELIIKNEKGYTNEFKELLKDYYLHL